MSLLSIGGDGELAELSLLYSNVPITMDAVAAKVLGPVSISIVNYE